MKLTRRKYLHRKLLEIKEALGRLTLRVFVPGVGGAGMGGMGL